MLFTFPSQYLFAIGLMGVFSLAGWSRQIHAGFLVSRATQDTARVPTGFAYGGVTLCAPPFQGVRLPVILPISRSYYPAAAWTAAVRAPPRSLATTCGISVDVFSCPYLDVSVQGVPLMHLFYSVHDT